MMNLRFPAMVAALTLTGCVWWGPTAENFTLDPIYQDHMVLQCDLPLRICGTGDPGARLTVALAGEQTTVRVGPDGRWTAELDAMPPGGPCELVVTGRRGTPPLVRRDVLIGEVWLASGQSNMEWPLRRARNGEAEVAQANHAQIRLFQTPKTLAPGGPRQEVAGGSWKVCTPESAADFSAVAYFFARQFQRDRNVPVGIIESSWGGTPILSWMSPQSFDAPGLAAARYARDSASLTPDQLAPVAAREKRRADNEFEAWLTLIRNTYALQISEASGWNRQDLILKGWTPVTLPAALPPDFDGAVYYRRQLELPEAWLNHELELSLGVIDDCDEVFFNGQRIGATLTDTPNYYAQFRRYRIPAHLVRQQRDNTLAIRVLDLFGGGGFQSPAAALALRRADGEGETLSLAGPWLSRVEFTIESERVPARPEPFSDRVADRERPNYPGTLYNGMIAPWTRFPLRGIIWYQGEQNVGDPRGYYRLQKLLIEDWRQQWGLPELAFVLTQLAPLQEFGARLEPGFWKREPIGNDQWSQLREAQAAVVRRVPRTGMAVTLDVGDPSDIHPIDKEPVGYRLAREAERIVYGEGPTPSAGPVFERMEIEGDRARLHFRNATDGLVAKGGKLGGFVLAGEDRRWVRAEAEVDGDTVLIHAPGVSRPKHVRYGWARYPGDANLYNTAGFPAGPFRTDAPDYLGR